MSTWRAEITISSIFPSAADRADPSSGAVYSAYLSAEDEPTGQSLGIEARCIYDPTLNRYKMVYLFYYTLGDEQLPAIWSLNGDVTNTVEDLSVGFIFPQGITLAMQKRNDPANSQDIYSYIVPLAGVTSAFSFSRPQGPDSASDFLPACFGHGIDLPSASEASGGETCFQNFYGYKDGMKILGAALTTVDPGTWLATLISTSTSFSAGPGPAVPHTETQDISCYRMTFTQSVPPQPRDHTYAMRCWDGGMNITEPMPFFVDACVSPTTGTVMVAVVREVLASSLIVYRSTDNGATFSAHPVSTNPAERITWPSILVGPNGWVYLFYRNGQEGLLPYAISYNDGITWQTGHRFLILLEILPFPGPFVLLAPRFRIDGHGVIWSVALITAGAQSWLTVEREGSVAFHLPPSSPHNAKGIIDTSFTEGFWPDLYWLMRDEARVFYRHSATGRLSRSSSWGNNWEVLANHRPNDRRQSSAVDPARQVTYHVFGDNLTPSTVYCARSGDGGVTFSQTTAVVGAVLPQFAAVTVAHRGQVFVFAFTGPSLALVLHCYRSDNWGVLFADTGAVFA